MVINMSQAIHHKSTIQSQCAYECDDKLDDAARKYKSNEKHAADFHALCIYNCWKRFRESFADDPATP